MMVWLLAMAVEVSGQDHPPPDSNQALIVEWEVRWLGRDVLERRREIHRRERLKIQPQRLRIEDETFGMVWIIRGDRERVWVIDPLGRRYSELSFEGIHARHREMIDELSEAALRVKGTTQEQEMVRMMKGMGRFEVPPRVEIQETGLKEEILGRSCVQKEVVMDGDTHLVSVFVDAESREGLAYFDLLAKIGGFPPEVANKLSELGGFPLKGTLRYLFLGERVRMEVQAASIGRGPVLEDDFELPQGLERVPLPVFETKPEREVPIPAVLRPEEEEGNKEREQP